jgi:hypothetical protein
MSWVTVYTTSQVYQSELISAILENEGIVVCDLNKRDSTYNTFGLIEVKVPKDQEEESIRILKHHQFLQ